MTFVTSSSSALRVAFDAFELVFAMSYPLSYCLAALLAAGINL